MAREMTPQERAEQLYGSLTCTTYRDGYQDPDNDIALIADVLQQTRRAALLEAANAMQKRYDESYDWSPLIENTIAELKRLAQEGS